MASGELYTRLRAWSRSQGIRLRRDVDSFELVWSDARETHFIEVHLSCNGFAARCGLLHSTPTAIAFEGDKQALTSWYCAPYDDLEQILTALKRPRASDTGQNRDNRSYVTV